MIKKEAHFLVLLMFCLTGCSKKSIEQPIITPSTPPVVANGLPVTVSINQNQPGYSISPTFEGVSYEIGLLAKTQTFLNANNTVLIQLIKNLGNGIIRVGGNSSDKTSWTGQTRTPNTGTDSLAKSDVDNLSAFAKATGWQVLYGLNLGGNNPTAAANEAQYVSGTFSGSLYALQIGNEADLFKSNGLRLPSYSYANYQQEWTTYVDAIKKVVPSAVFAGPDVADNTSWVTSFADAENKNVRLIDGHYYRTGPATNPAITYQTLLTPTTQLSTYLQSLNTASLKYNLPYRVSECNSVYAGGKAGVSDVFASSLWALDFMWTVAENNGQGINFHGGTGGAYSPIVSTDGVVTARPEYYAMLAFKYGNLGGKIVPALINQSQSNCSAYASVNGGTTCVTLINKDITDLSFTVQLSNTASGADVSRLSAPSITSTTGVTFAGNMVNADGTFKLGTPEHQTINGKTLIVNVPAGSAAVVTIK